MTNAVSGTEVVERSEMDYDALLINGHPVHIAPARLADLGRVRLFYQYLSNASTYYRFFGIRRAIPERELLNIVDPHVEEHVTLLATIQGELAGIGEFIVDPSKEEAEVAFAVADDHHHEGIATLLLEALVVIARRRNIRRLTAVTLRDNADMLLVFRTVGLPESTVLDEDGIVHVTFDLLADDELQQRSTERRLHAMHEATPSID
ncbi:MAG TPA: GNAT family N-acetyltransferase [Ilumatobacteraceae bacterium]|nr:GNAT family N-acetyltransferase [Ilumatobacteraceae bacterium]